MKGWLKGFNPEIYYRKQKKRICSSCKYWVIGVPCEKCSLEVKNEF